jgi:prepilin-type processing-associated H-X9-DG protein
MSLLSPSLRSLYHKSQKISCQKHLSEFGVAEHMHAEDHDGFFCPMSVVGVGNWNVNNKFISYFDNNKRPVCSGGGQYGMNTWKPWLKGRKTKAININNSALAPQEIVRYADGTHHFVSGFYDIASLWVSQGESAERQPAFRHLDTANAVYFDGHLESLDLVEHFSTQLKEENFKFDINIEQRFSYDI